MTLSASRCFIPLAAALLLALPSPAQADPGELELSVSPLMTWYSSETTHPVAEENVNVAPTVRVGYGLTDMLDVYLGYRYAEPLSRFVEGGITYRTDMHAIIAGARATLGLYDGWFRAYAQLDIEATAATFDVDLGTARNGEQTSWGVGVVPEIGLEAQWQISESFAIFARLGVGYALRLDHDFDAVEISAGDAERVEPVDFGAANLSGLTFGWTFGMSF